MYFDRLYKLFILFVSIYICRLEKKKISEQRNYIDLHIYNAYIYFEVRTLHLHMLIHNNINFIYLFCLLDLVMIVSFSFFFD